MKLKAFTLFESVVAITIITVCLAIGTLVYSNIVKSEKTVVSFEATNEIKRLFSDIKKTKLYFGKIFNFSTYEVVQKVENYQGIEHLYHISYELLVGKKSSFVKHYLLYDPES